MRPDIGRLPLLNQAARYFPVVRLMRRHVTAGGRILEIGSGPHGIGWFVGVPFVGCDVRFDRRPSPPMIPAVGSALALPFTDHSFAAVVVSDVLEHVVPALRPRVIAEALRVTGSVAVFGFPCGAAAFDLDRVLSGEYRRRALEPPEWLREHMRHPFPERALFDAWTAKPGWRVEWLSNEGLRFHAWMMRRELGFLWRNAFRVALTVLPGATAALLRRLDAEPAYRCIVALTRVPSV